MLLNVTFCHFRFSKNWLHGNQLLTYNKNMKQNAINYRSLLAAIIGRALDDIQGIGPESERQAEPDNERYGFYSFRNVRNILPLHGHKL
jgi:hypothetical protein